MSKNRTFYCLFNFYSNMRKVFLPPMGKTKHVTPRKRVVVELQSNNDSRETDVIQFNIHL